MKKIILISLFFLPILSFGQYSDTYLQSEADTIQSETNPRNNNKTRLTRMYKNIIANKWNGQNLTTTGSSGPATFNYSTGVLNIPNYGLASGITNSAANTELMMSDGTNAVSSSLFADGSGDITLGKSTSIGNTRTITAAGSGSNIGVYISAKGTQQNTIQGDFVNFTSNSAGFQLYLKLTNSLNPGIEAFKTGTSGSQPLIFYAADGISTSTSGQDVNITGGSGYASGATNGGSVILSGGTANSSGNPGYVSVSGIFTTPAIVLSTISSTQNNYNIGNGTIFKVDASGGTQQITGITNGIDGRLLIIRNTGSTNVINFNTEDTGSSPGNRIHSSTGTTLSLNPGKVIMFFYDLSLGRWVDISF